MTIKCETSITKSTFDAIDPKEEIKRAMHTCFKHFMKEFEKDNGTNRMLLSEIKKSSGVFKISFGPRF